jgi:SAM-dependent methyltransferase
MRSLRAHFCGSCPGTAVARKSLRRGLLCRLDGGSEDKAVEDVGPEAEKHRESKQKRPPAGCGMRDSAFLQLAQNNGWEIRGTEYSPYAAKFAGDLLKADIYCGHLMDARYEDSFFDVVTFWHVLEHLHDPMRYLQEAHRILKPSGQLVIAVPNVNDYIMQLAYRLVKGRSLKLFSKDDREIHLYHFSAETLRKYLRETGFECQKISPDYGITDYSKKLINTISVAIYYTTGLKIFNALEAHAVRI